MAEANQPFDAKAYAENLRRQAEEERLAHQQSLEQQFARERVLGSLGMSRQSSMAVVGEYLKGHAVGVDRGPLDQRWSSFNVYPALQESEISSLTAAIAGAAKDYVKIEGHPGLPPIQEIVDSLATPVAFEQREASRTQYTQLRLSRLLPKDFLKTVASILTGNGIDFDMHALSIASATAHETLKGPYTLALRPEGTLRASFFKDGQRVEQAPVVLLSNEFDRSASEPYFVERGEGEHNPWIAAEAEETDESMTQAPTYRTSPSLAAHKEGVWVQFELQEKPSVRYTETGVSATMPRVLRWNVRAQDAKDAVRIVQSYGVYFRAAFEPSHPMPQRPLPPNPPRPPELKQATMQLAYPQQAAAQPQNQQEPEYPTTSPNNPPPSGGQARMQMRSREM